jgi:ribonucleoside-diphosphate reductase alpha chain
VAVCSSACCRSATVYFPIWHYDFESLVVLKNNQGTEETRARQLDYGVQMAAMFWERLIQKKNITLFSPSEVPGLYDLFHQDIAKFEQEYAKFEADPAIRKKVVSADEAIRTLFATERSGTGRIYAYNVDNVQFQGSYDPTTDTVTQSNLCCVVGDCVYGGFGVVVLVFVGCRVVVGFVVYGGYSLPLLQICLVTS